MASHPLTPEHDRLHQGEHLEALLGTPSDAMSWQAGLDEIDSFYASCKTTPRQSVNQVDQKNLSSKDVGHIQGNKGSCSFGGLIANVAETEHQECGVDVSSKLQSSCLSERGQSQEQSLLQPPDKTISSAATFSAAGLAETAPPLSSVYVEADYPSQHGGCPSSTTVPVARPDNNLPTDDEIDPGCPMEVDNPQPKLAEFQTPFAVFGNKIHSFHSSKSSLIAEMESEDLGPTYYAPENETPSKPPFGREIARNPDVSPDLLNHHYNPDLPSGVSKGDFPSFGVKGRQLQKITTTDVDRPHREIPGGVRMPVGNPMQQPSFKQTSFIDTSPSFGERKVASSTEIPRPSTFPIAQNDREAMATKIPNAVQIPDITMPPCKKPRICVNSTLAEDQRPVQDLQGGVVVNKPVPQRGRGKSILAEKLNVGEGRPARGGSEDSTKTDVMIPSQVADECRTDNVEIQPTEKLKGRGKSTLSKELRALGNSDTPPRRSDRGRPVRSGATKSTISDATVPPDAATARKTSELGTTARAKPKGRGKSTLVKELEALRTPGMLPDQSDRPLTGRPGTERKHNAKATTTKPKRRVSSPKTRAQHLAEPSGAAAAKRRHSVKG